MSTAMIYQTVSTSSADTEQIGEQLGKLLSPPTTIELRSDLGGGKTTFVKGLTRGFGSQDRVASPTFTLSKIYQSGKGEIHHFDFYRLSEAGVLADQLSESLNNQKAITVIEWSDIVKNVLPKEYLSIEFKPTASNPDERQITFRYFQKDAKIILELQQLWQRESHD